MRAFLQKAVLAVVATLLLAALEASATNYSLWIHGKNEGGTQAGNHADFSNWGPSSVSAGVNKKAVNWNGSQRISVENYRSRNALDKWSYHTVEFRDDNEAYDHHARGNWEGIVGVVRADMATYAY